VNRVNAAHDRRDCTVPPRRTITAVKRLLSLSSDGLAGLFLVSIG
jgi:hypothetical protein